MPTVAELYHDRKALLCITKETPLPIRANLVLTTEQWVSLLATFQVLRSLHSSPLTVLDQFRKVLDTLDPGPFGDKPHHRWRKEADY